MNAKERAGHVRTLKGSIELHLKSYRTARRAVALHAARERLIPSGCDLDTEISFHAIGLAEDLDALERLGGLP